MMRHPELARTGEHLQRETAYGEDGGSPAGVQVHVDPGAATAVDLAARFFRVLGDPTRIRLLSMLLDAPAGECSVGELVAALDVPQSRVSTHLACLRWCGLVQTRREGRQVYYRVADPRVRELLALGDVILHAHAAGIASCGMLR
jgi:DNA-binding transcriptional ArsR family regulator